jgi:hypothetical protein
VIWVTVIPLRDGVAIEARLHSLKRTSTHEQRTPEQSRSQTACASFDQRKPSTVSKTPNLVQKPTGPTIYPKLNLPKVTQIPLAVDPNSYSRPSSAPTIQANKGQAVRPPQVR